jgi:DNA-3-methyladenine glycosylase I
MPSGIPQPPGFESRLQALRPRVMIAKPNTLIRCAWASNELSIRYHDEEWGVPVHDDRTLFEFLILEGALAGLSWNTILNKRDNYGTQGSSVTD